MTHRSPWTSHSNTSRSITYKHLKAASSSKINPSSGLNTFAASHLKCPLTGQPMHLRRFHTKMVQTMCLRVQRPIYGYFINGKLGIRRAQINQERISTVTVSALTYVVHALQIQCDSLFRPRQKAEGGLQGTLMVFLLLGINAFSHAQFFWAPGALLMRHTDSRHMSSFAQHGNNKEVQPPQQPPSPSPHNLFRLFFAVRGVHVHFVSPSTFKNEMWP